MLVVATCPTALPRVLMWGHSLQCFIRRDVCCYAPLLNTLPGQLMVTLFMETGEVVRKFSPGWHLVSWWLNKSKLDKTYIIHYVVIHSCCLLNCWLRRRCAVSERLHSNEKYSDTRPCRHYVYFIWNCFSYQQSAFQIFIQNIKSFPSAFRPVDAFVRPGLKTISWVKGAAGREVAAPTLITLALSLSVHSWLLFFHKWLEVWHGLCREK